MDTGWWVGGRQQEAPGQEGGQQKAPRRPEPARRLVFVARRRLEFQDVGGLRTFLAVQDFELHFLALGQRLETVGLDGGEMDEDILTVLPLDETVSFGVVEPLHLSRWHRGAIPPCRGDSAVGCFASVPDPGRAVKARPRPWGAPSRGRSDDGWSRSVAPRRR